QVGSRGQKFGQKFSPEQRTLGLPPTRARLAVSTLSWSCVRSAQVMRPADPPPNGVVVMGRPASPAPRSSSRSFERREDGKRCVPGENLGNQVNLRADSAGEPVAVAVD